MSSHERYMHGHHESVLRSHLWRTAENSAAYLIPHLFPGARVLDVGSGPGTITLDFSRLVAPGVVTGIDASVDIVAQAAGLAMDNGLGNAKFAVGDAYHLDFPDDTFDIVHAHQVLQHLGDPVAALREFKRVLKPGGLVAARDVDYGATIWAPESEGLAEWLRVYQAVARGDGGDPFAGRHLKAWVLAAGFTDVAGTASVWCFASDAEREWWGSSWSVRATESDFAVHAIEDGHATADDLQGISAAWLRWAKAPEGWFTTTHGEILARK